MASYRIEWKQSARKELRRLQKFEIARILRAVEGLADEPRPGGCRKLAGADINYRIRVGDIRVIYSVLDDRLAVHIIRVGHRGRVYRT
jgi:mRNA interferase RelE/StbE